MSNDWAAVVSLSGRLSGHQGCDLDRWLTKLDEVPFRNDYIHQQRASIQETHDVENCDHPTLVDCLAVDPSVIVASGEEPILLDFYRQRRRLSFGTWVAGIGQQQPSTVSS